MFRALYDYKTDMKQYLSFQTGDQFTVLDSSNKDWFLAQNGFGEIGYVPKNYVVKDQASESDVLRSIDRAIEVIHYAAGSKGGQYTHAQRENLKKLVQHRENVVRSYREGLDSTEWVIVPEQSAQPPAAKGEQAQKRSVRRSAPAPPILSLGATSHDARKSRVETCNSESHSKDGAANLASDLAETAKVSSRLTQESLQNQGLQYTCSTSTNHSRLGLSDQNVDQNCSDFSVLQIQKEQVASGKEVTAKLNNEKATKVKTVSVTDSATSPISSPEKLSSLDFAVNCQVIPVPDDLGSCLVEEVRKTTGLSYKKSCVAMETVLTHIGLHIPGVSELMDRIHATLNKTSTDSVEEESGFDYDRLCELFRKLTECKDDSQQRGWHLHEDEDMIRSNLEEMVSILENAKPGPCRRALAQDGYEGVYNLVQYYQMENRLGLRMLLLQVFGAMCALDSGVISLLLFSVLTTELAEELQHNIEDVQRCGYVSLVLTMLFCTGEPVPADRKSVV